MVRHECAEALGAIGDESVLSLLLEYSKDPCIEISETCQIASDLIKWKTANVSWLFFFSFNISFKKFLLHYRKNPIHLELKVIHIIHLTLHLVPLRICL